MVGILPISFAGVGTRELASVALFTLALGVAADTVFAFTLVGFLITDVVTGFIGFLLTLTEAKPRALFDSFHEQ